jgi:hypothetical protein
MNVDSQPFVSPFRDAGPALEAQLNKSAASLFDDLRTAWTELLEVRMLSGSAPHPSAPEYRRALASLAALQEAMRSLPGGTPR